MATTAESIYNNLSFSSPDEIICYATQDGTVFSTEIHAELYNQIFLAYRELLGDRSADQEVLFFQVLKLIIEGE